MLLIIGSGRTATHFCHYFHQLEIPFHNWNRKQHSIHELKRFVPLSTRILLLISDDAISEFITDHLLDYSGLILHMSGAMEIPEAISLHPLMTFGNSLYELSFYKKIPFVLLRGHRLPDFFPELPNPDFAISADDKSKYHALCVLSGNFTTLLWQEAFQGFEKMSLPREIALPYMQKIMENLVGTEKPLTGPLARKDVTTVDANLQSIAGEPAETIYRAFVKTYFGVSFVKTIDEFAHKKLRKEKISMITCYDSWSAKIINETSIDTVLVGDSLAMVMHGFNSTLNASVKVMALHVAAVARSLTGKFLIGDMPFLSYRQDLSHSVAAAGTLMKAGAHAVKLEGAAGNLEMIRHLVDTGIPVMGHLGLTPQSVNQLGGFRVQAKDLEHQEILLKQAHDLQSAGCFSLVLECVPAKLAAEVTASLEIPTIGIGAGVDCDGQVLVLQDMLGMNRAFSPKFLKKYMDGFQLIQSALEDYHTDVTTGEFPTQKESY